MDWTGDEIKQEKEWESRIWNTKKQNKTWQWVFCFAQLACTLEAMLVMLYGSTVTSLLWMLSVEVRLFHGTTRKALQWPTYRRLWYGKMIYSGRNRSFPLGFQSPISFRPTMEKVQTCPQQAKTNISVQSFWFILKLSILGAHAVCCRLSRR